MIRHIILSQILIATLLFQWSNSRTDDQIHINSYSEESKRKSVGNLKSMRKENIQKNMITLLQILVSSTFMVEKQPPQVR